MIDVDTAVENTMVVFSAIEELRKDTKEGWKKLAVPLDQVIEANNASNVGLKKRDVQLARVMDMVIFRTIFFELFSFLHVHAPYPPFCLLTNLGKHQKTRQNTDIQRPM